MRPGLLLFLLLAGCADHWITLRGVAFSQGKPLGEVSMWTTFTYCDPAEPDDPYVRPHTSKAAGGFELSQWVPPDLDHFFLRFSKQGFETVCLELEPADCGQGKGCVAYPELKKTGE